MGRDRWVQWVAGAVLAASLAVSVVLTTSVAASQGRHGLTYADRAEEGEAPEVALGIAMGAFRGLFVNTLWMRANEAKEKGNFYEAIDLAKTITRLQPRFPRVWAFHAWNMAYNISVATQTATERWNWVNQGIRLLREEGIPANPNDLVLHRELAWIHLHKIQGVMDDANQYYKRRFAEEWTIVLGPPRAADPANARPLLTRTRAEAIEDAVKLLERVQKAPDTLAGVLQQRPEAGAVIERLRGMNVDVSTPAGRLSLLRAVELGRAMARLRAALEDLTPVFESPVIALLGDPALVPVWEVLVPHVRKRVLVDDYRMEPERMIRTIRIYGPMDWRHPAAHALYWAARGVDESQVLVTEANRGDFDFVNADRVKVQAVQELYRSGTLIFDIAKPQYYLAMPDANFIPTYRAILADLVDREHEQGLTRGANVKERLFNLYAAGYENFMKDAIVFVYRRGQVEEAKELQTLLLQDFYAGRLNRHQQVNTEYELTRPLEEFVLQQLNDRITTPSVAVQEIVGALQGAFIYGLLNNDLEAFRNQFNYAARFHRAYMSEQFRQVNVDPERARLELLPRDFADAAGQIFAGIALGMGVEEASIMYRRAPGDLQAAAYDVLAEQLREALDGPMKAAVEAGDAAIPPGFDRWFPAPSGLEAYRAAQRQRAGTRPDNVQRGVTQER